MFGIFVPVASVIRHSKEMSSVACLALLYFSTLSHKPHSSGEKAIEHKACVVILSTTFA
jgi:hypothetical protein